MTTNHRNICRRKSKSDGDMKEVATKDSVVSRSHSTLGSICTWLKKRKKSKDDIDASSSSLSTVRMNDDQYRSSISLKNLENDDYEVSTEVEADDSQPQSYDTSDTDDALDDSLSTVKMSELSLTSRHLVHEAIEYERLVRTQTVSTKRRTRIE